MTLGNTAIGKPIRLKRESAGKTIWLVRGRPEKIAKLAKVAKATKKGMKDHRKVETDDK
jgi:hypothetical protein